MDLSTRLVMAPLTRMRATGHQVQDIHVEYYTQRSAYPGTFVITEATFISEAASGYPDAPGIYKKEHIEGWSKVFKAIHDQKSFVYVQLWALGRFAIKADLDHRGLPFVSSSAIAATDKEDDTETPVPIALTKEEIKQYVADYAQAAKNAIEAGADGVEIHSANGYLPDQFLHANSNNRTDEYGGSIENRARFLLEVIDAVIDAIGADRVAVRMSPWGIYGYLDPGVSPIPQFGYVLEELQARALAGKELSYVHVVEPRFTLQSGTEELLESPRGTNEFIPMIWKGKLIRAGGYELDTAERDTAANHNVLIAKGRDFLSTPDLIKRLQNHVPVNEYNRSLFYTGGAEGYTDYPFMSNESSVTA